MFKQADESKPKKDQVVPLSSFFAVLLCVAEFGLVIIMWWGHSLVTSEPFDSQRRIVGYGIIVGIVAYLLLKGFRDLRHVPVGAAGEMSITPLKALVVIVMLGAFTWLAMWLLGLFGVTAVIDAGQQ